MKKPLLLVSIIAVSGAINAAEWKNLDGIYAITGLNYLDPPVNEAQNSHFRVQLSGKSAQALYNAIQAPEHTDACTGALAKQRGELQCLYYAAEKRYDCHFSINLLEQKIEYGVAC